MASKYPSREDIDHDQPLRLAVAAALAFPDGSMTASGLRRRAPRDRNGHPADILVLDVPNIYLADKAEKHARPEQTKQRVLTLADFWQPHMLADVNGKRCRDMWHGVSASLGDRPIPIRPGTRRGSGRRASITRSRLTVCATPPRPGRCRTAPIYGRRRRPNCINCITSYPARWKVMRCTCKGWVLTTHPCRHCITPRWLKYMSAQPLRTNLYRLHRPASHHHAVVDAVVVQLHQMAGC